MSEGILIVEDDAALGHQIVGHLVRAGFQPTWIAHGDEALLEDPELYAMVILDLMLPGAYGLDVLKSFRQSSDVPVMVLSATSTLTLHNNFDIEPFYVPGGVWYDRANIGVHEVTTGTRTAVSPDGGRLYNASGSYCFRRRE